MNTLPNELRFPKPPFRIEGSSSSARAAEVVTGYLRQIGSWREKVLEFLHGRQDGAGAQIPDLSPRAEKALACFLASAWSQQMKDYALHSPYNIASFPIEALEHPKEGSLEPVMEVLRWRAGVRDYLSDIWDVIGEPMLEWDECSAMAEFLQPISEKRLCVFCLTEFDAERLHADSHTCPLLEHVRAKWPASPFKATAFKPVEAEPAQEEVRKPRSWWRFWGG